MVSKKDDTTTDRLLACKRFFWLQLLSPTCLHNGNDFDSLVVSENTEAPETNLHSFSQVCVG